MRHLSRLLLLTIALLLGQAQVKTPAIAAAATSFEMSSLDEGPFLREAKPLQRDARAKRTAGGDTQAILPELHETSLAMPRRAHGEGHELGGLSRMADWRQSSPRAPPAGKMED